MRIDACVTCEEVGVFPNQKRMNLALSSPLFSSITRPLATRSRRFHTVAKSHAIVKLNGSLNEVGAGCGKRGSGLAELRAAIQLALGLFSRKGLSNEVGADFDRSSS